MNNGRKDIPSCQFNKGVACEDWILEKASKGTMKCCIYCGWNPAEAADRIWKLRKGAVKDDRV